MQLSIQQLVLQSLPSLLKFEKKKQRRNHVMAFPWEGWRDTFSYKGKEIKLTFGRGGGDVECGFFLKKGDMN